MNGSYYDLCLSAWSGSALNIRGGSRMLKVGANIQHRRCEDHFSVFK